MNNKNEIIVKADSYVANVADIKSSIAEEMDGFTPTFESVKIPSGGGLAYELPGEDLDSPDMAKEFTGVILYHHPINVYYKDKFDGSNNPPECSSRDGKTGISGDTGEVCDCVKCEFAKFGSSEDGKGKACKQKRRIYVLRPGNQFPILLTLPTGSLAEFSKYVMRLLNRGKKTNSIVTKFSLKKAQNASGITYSQAVFAVDRELEENEREFVSSMSEQIKALATHIDVASDEE